jgi:polyphosphate kinase 2 (PPK2 family)
MLEHVDLTLKASKTEYHRQLPLLQANLYDLAHEVFIARIPVMIIFEGWAAAGKGSTINVLAERLDPRGFRVVPILPPRTQEARYPWMWRFWQKIPARGQMVAFDTSWYRRVLVDRATKAVKRSEWEAAYQDIRDFEEQLAADGMLIVKFWLHIGRKDQGTRMKKLTKDKLTAWQISAEDSAQHKAYDKYLTIVEEMLARTDAPYAPWTIVEATDRYHTRLKVFETVIRTLEGRMSQVPERSTASQSKEAAHA